MTVEQAASAAGVPLQYLRLLEGESNVRVGVSDELYLIPFFRKYASFMSIDAEELLPEFLGMVQQIPPDTSPPLRLAYRPRYAGLWKPLAVLLTIAIAVTLLLRQTRERPSFEEASSVDASGTATTGASPTPEPTIVPPAAGIAPAALPATENASSPTSTPSIPSGPSTPSPTPGGEATALGGHALTIAAKEDAWLALATDDQPAKQYLLRAGESRSWTATRFSLTVGNAGGVALSLDGRELPPIGKPGQVIRNLRFPDVAASPNPTPS
jgi:cytoskeletal protein RodZ